METVRGGRGLLDWGMGAVSSGSEPLEEPHPGLGEGRGLLVCGAPGLPPPSPVDWPPQNWGLRDSWGQAEDAAPEDQCGVRPGDGGT